MTSTTVDDANGSAAPGSESPPRLWAGSQAAGRQERRDATTNRQRILAAAQALFAAQGAAAVSMVDIARAAGVAHGTLYRRYASKAAVCEALLEGNLASFYERVRGYMAAEADRAAALAQLEWLFTELLAFVAENASLLSALTEAHGPQSGSAYYGNPWYRWLHETATERLTQAARAGETAVLDGAGVAYGLLALCNPDLYLYQREQGFTDARMASVLQQFIQGLRTQTPGATVAGNRVGS
jgi:AcrR family transcriptional regulator